MPYTGDYIIEAMGAAGGYDTNPNSTQYRGKGARMIGTFPLNKGEVIQILVGQEGVLNKVGHSNGGGGGTFVVRGAKTPLIIAGGGGGTESARSRHSGCDASTGSSGNPGYKSWSGGSNGHGAQTADADNSGKWVVLMLSPVLEPKLLCVLSTYHLNFVRKKRKVKIIEVIINAFDGELPCGQIGNLSLFNVK